MGQIIWGKFRVGDEVYVVDSPGVVGEVSTVEVDSRSDGRMARLKYGVLWPDAPDDGLKYYWGEQLRKAEKTDDK